MWLALTNQNKDPLLLANQEQHNGQLQNNAMYVFPRLAAVACFPALGTITVLAANSDWLIGLFSFNVIGRSFAISLIYLSFLAIKKISKPFHFLDLSFCFVLFFNRHFYPELIPFL